MGLRHSIRMEKNVSQRRIALGRPSILESRSYRSSPKMVDYFENRNRSTEGMMERRPRDIFYLLCVCLSVCIVFVVRGGGTQIEFGRRSAAAAPQSRIVRER